LKATFAPCYMLCPVELSHGVTLYYDVVHCAVLRCASPCYAVLRRATPCYAVLRRATPCYAVLRRATPCYAVLRRATPCYAVLRRATPCYAFIRCAMLYRCLHEITCRAIWLLPATMK
jgi:hypothetical protein